VLKEAMRTVFLLAGINWLAIGVIALLIAATETRVRKIVVFLCGVALILNALIALDFMGWFIGDELLGIAGVLVLCGALLFRSAPKEISSSPEATGVSPS
jgi:hypothetical protein